VLTQASSSGRVVALNHEFREMPIFRAVLDEARKPGAGDIAFAQVWQLVDLPPRTEAGWRGQLHRRTLYEAGVHLLDFLMALFEEMPTAVHGVTSGGTAGESTADAIVLLTLEFSRGRLAQLTQNRLYHGQKQYFEVRVDTERESLRASFGGRARISAGLFRASTPHARFEFGRSGLAWREIGAGRTVIARNPSDPRMAATRQVLEKTIRAFQNGSAPPASGRDGRRILEVIVACYHSAATGRRVALASPEVKALTSFRLGA
jgi:predicted dehydrogenase